MRAKRRKNDARGATWVGAALVVALGGFIAYAQFGGASLFAIEYSAVGLEEDKVSTLFKRDSEEYVEHIKTPEPLKAVYMTSWVAGTPDFRESILGLIAETEINAVVIDIKDDTGRISFEVKDEELREIGSWEERIPDARELVQRLHDMDVYVIGRISVFQDPFYTKSHPEISVRRASDGAVWKDFKGLSFIDPAAREYHDYIVNIAREAYGLGFDEINFDYVRFPSDGNMRDISFPVSGTRPKPEVVEDFFAYLHRELRTDDGDFIEAGSAKRMAISADLFGMTTTNTDDLNIGQVLERTLPYFDYVAPMVYPSHYPAGWNGWAKPATLPYEVVKYGMDSAVERTRVLADTAASSTLPLTTTRAPRELVLHVSPAQLRPWLQDFDLGAIYTADMVRAQMQATYDVGLTSWSLWDAGNTYTRAALQPE